MSYTLAGRDPTQQTENFMSATAIGILEANPYFILAILSNQTSNATISYIPYPSFDNAVLYYLATRNLSVSRVHMLLM